MDQWPAAVAYVELLITKFYFRQIDRIHAFLLSINRLTAFYSVVEVSACFWTAPSQPGAEGPYLYALNTHLTNRNKKGVPLIDHSLLLQFVLLTDAAAVLVLYCRFLKKKLDTSNSRSSQ